MGQEMTPAQILKPYQIFDPTPAVEGVEAPPVHDEIMRDPHNCRLPDDNNLKWATITAMVEKLTPENFGPLATYADRFSLNFRILFYRMVMVKQPALRSHRPYIKAMSQLTQYLQG